MDDDGFGLFEGMDLFTPSQLDEQHLIASIQGPAAPNNEDSSSCTTPPQQQQQRGIQLDENLFSDLTLVASHLQTQSSDDPIPAAPSPTPRKNKKKKRAATLKIGYARQSHDDAEEDDDIDLPPSSSTHAIEATTPDSQFQRLKSQISDKLQRFIPSAASISSARKDAISCRRKAAHHLNSASSKHKDLELQLEAACEAEDFESAQRISDCLAASDNHRHSLLLALKDAEALCNSLDSNMHHLLDSQILAEQQCAALLSTFAKDAETNADLVFKKAHLLSSQQLDDWFSSTEALEAKKIELDIQSHILKEARQLVNTSIDHSVADYKIQQDILYNKKDLLNDELHQLLALVKAKQYEIAENDSNIQAIEQTISDVASGFQDTQSSINAKYHHLQSELSHVHLSNESLSKKREEIDRFLADEEAHGAKLRELARAAEEEAKAYQEVIELRQSLMLSVFKSREDRVSLAETEEKLVEDVQSLQQEASSARDFLQELSSTKSNIQKSIASFKQRIFFIDKRAPELEAEKKVAAAARNFKEAARIAAEAKSLSVEKDGMQVDLEKATAELEKLEEDIKNTISRLQDTEKLISSKEKEVAMARFHSLLLIAGVARAESAAALELGDTEEAKLLFAEAEAANAEAKKLQPIYNFNEEDLPNLPKHFISVELISKLGRKQLVELAASVDVSASR
ncbi:uncharacterized protein LOC126664530 [Mercurialis annua]|uniref:uncharacterized protein LOC126664530 n=1 Tax=Mercurialis annua TaxID=3986 RepID=UPI002160B9B5|nr:uncharacterized protein LOC126664530 [Mercurialis annua]